MSGATPSDRRLLAGNFLVLDQLDTEGRVFKAHDRRHRRIVAVKLLSPTVSGDPSSRRAFLAEIEAARRVKHPNVAAVLGADEDRGHPLIVTEYVEGADLERVVRDRGPLPLGQAIAVLEGAARGLAAVHAAGIVHRDVRPSRLKIDADGTVRVLGSGLSRPAVPGPGMADLEGPQPLDRESRLHSADFCAPEVFDDPGRPDPRFDIYSLGCLTYFLLAGREPFVGETLEERVAARRERPAPELRLVRPDVPSKLDAIYRRMMARRPEDRPASMADVVAALESLRMEEAPSPAGGSAGMEQKSGGGTRGANRPAKPAPTRKRPAGGDAGSPIGPEFDLEGLDIESGPVPRSEARSAAYESSPRRLAVPVIILAFAGSTIFAILGMIAFRRRDAEDRSGGAATVAGSERADPTRAAESEKTTREPHRPEPAWASRTIFDGKNADDWMLTSLRPVPAKNVQADGLNPHGTGSYLVVYKRRLGDFILDFDYKLGRGGDSGVFLRVGRLDDPVHTGIEVSIQDSDGKGPEDPGAIFGLVAPAVNAQKPAGHWNHMTIAARGPEIIVMLNGSEVSRIRLDEWTVPGKRPDGSAHEFAGVAHAGIPRSGFLGFQDLVGDCWFKNVVIKTPNASP